MARIISGSRPEVEVVDTVGRGPYGRRWTSSGSLVFVLILVLLTIWLYRNRSPEVFGEQTVIDVPAQVSATPVEIGAAPVDPPIEAIPEQPRVIVRERPVVIAARPPLPSAGQQSDIMGYARVISDSVNLRARPGFQYDVISVLPRNYEVTVLNQLHVYHNGEAWVEVMALTNQGWRKGWVMRNYLDSCNCPTY
jgi:SH3 domain-containing protein